jgi:intracellular multiplication protein IcmD
MNTKSVVKITKIFMPIFVLLFIGFADLAMAAPTGSESLVQVVSRVEGNVLSIARLLILISYVAGVGFAMAGVLQFKAHKDNPTQTPLSKPVVYLCVGAFLLFLPSLMGTAGKSIFGGNTGDTPTSSINITDIDTASGNQ